MDGPTHSVRRQSLTVAAGDEGTAMALRARVADLNRERLLPAIAAVLDARAPAGRRVRIDRLDLDLGPLPLDGLEEAAVAALTRRLNEALDAALGPSPPPGGPRVLSDDPEEAAALAVAEHYLVHGTFPYWAARDSTPAPRALLDGLMTRDPAGFVALVRRLGGRRPVIERLVVQGGDGLLRRLLEGLDPGNAALVMAYLLDLEGIHRAEPILALSDRSFARLVRVLALSYVARDAGTQFNRRSFVRSLIEGMAEEEGLTFAEVLESLTRGLELTAHALPLNASLPAVIRELLADLPEEERPVPDRARIEDGAAAALAAAVERLWSGTGGDARLPDGGTMAPEEALRRLDAADPHALAALVRRYGRRTEVIERLVAALDEAALQRLLHRLDPPDAALIIAYVLDLEELHGARPVVALGPEPFARMLRVLVFSYVVRDAGTQFNRRSFVRALLGGIADRHGLDLGLIVAVLCQGLAITERRRPLSSSLPAVIRDLAADLARLAEEAAEAAPPAAEAAPSAVAPSAALVAALPPDERRAALAAAAASPAQTRRLVRALTGHEAPVVLALLDVLTALPAPLRRGPPEAIRAAVLDELMRWRGGDPADLIESLLRRLYGQPLPEPVVEALAAVADRWADAGLTPPAAVAALRRALAAAAGDTAAAEREPPEPADPAAVLAALTKFLERGVHLDDAVLDALPGLIDVGDAGVMELLRRAVASAGARSRLAAALPETLLGRIVRVVEPHGFASLITAAELLAQAWSEAAPATRPGPGDRGGFWRFLLDFVAAPAAERTVERLAPAFLAHTAAVARSAGAGEAEREGMLARLRHSALRLAGRAGQAVLAAVLGAGGAGASSARGWESGERPRRRDLLPLRLRTAFRFGDGGREAVEPLLIDNAGLVLTGPFLPYLFTQLGLLVPDSGRRSRLRDAEAVGRAVHLLQFLVDGRTDTPEPRLALNKVLCGVPPEAPVPPSIGAEPAETALCEHLLREMIRRWTIIQNTSVTGLREFFLQREGRLERVGDAWSVTVQRRTVDVLVDQVPWTTSLILNPWQAEPVHVHW